MFGLIVAIVAAVVIVAAALADSLSNAGQDADSNFGDGPVGNTVAHCPSQICAGEDNKQLQKALDEQAIMLQDRKKELETWDDAAKANFMKWFGTTDEEARKTIKTRVDNMIALNKKTTVDNLQKPEEGKQKDSNFAYVYSNDKSHNIYLDKSFCSAANTGTDSRAGTLCHEMSHFSDIGGTSDHIYGKDNAIELAKKVPAKALTNADNFEYYMENAK